MWSGAETKNAKAAQAQQLRASKQCHTMLIDFAGDTKKMLSQCYLQYCHHVRPLCQMYI